MHVRRQLRNRKRVRLFATFLAERMTITDVNWRHSLQVWQPKIHAPVTPKRRAQQTKQRLVLINRQELTVTQRPALRRETETEDSDFREKWFCHDFLLHEVKLELRVQSLDC